MNVAEPLDEMGPIDYLVIEWPDGEPTGEAAPLLVDLVDRGLIRIMDLAFVAKDGELPVTMIDMDADPRLAELAGASSGLLTEEDIADAAEVLEPGTAAGVLVYENS